MITPGDIVFDDGGELADAIEAGFREVARAMEFSDSEALRVALRVAALQVARLCTIGTPHSDAAFEDTIAALRQLAITYHPVAPS